MNKFLLLIFFGLACLSPVVAEIKCFDCHENHQAAWPKNRHSALEAACEACHGSGAKHLESMAKKDIVNPAKLEASESIKLCGGCHFINPKNNLNKSAQKIDRELYQKSIHHQMGFSCLNCHDPHKVANPKLLKGKEVKLICFQCHEWIKPTFDKTAHGKQGLQCTDCHQPHGSINDKLFKHTEKGGDICMSCHEEEPHHFIADKRTRKMEKLKCTGCHEAHSKVKKYLKYKKEDLCINCHREFY